MNVIDVAKALLSEAFNISIEELDRNQDEALARYCPMTKDRKILSKELTPEQVNRYMAAGRIYLRGVLADPNWVKQFRQQDNKTIKSN